MSARRACSGVALSGALASEFAPLDGLPITSARIVETEDLDPAAAARSPAPLWSVDAGGAAWELHATPDGGLVFSVSGTPALAIDLSGETIAIGAHRTVIAAQLVAAVAAPALAVARGALALHGSAVAMDGAATLFVGPSGAGKSSLLAALVDAGATPIAEDVTVLDVAPDGDLRAWPGPPWVRLHHGQPGPIGSEQRPDPTDKAAWDLTGRMAPGPVTLERVVVLGAATVDAAKLRPIAPAQAIAAIPPHVAWLSAAPRAHAAFAAAVTISRRVPVVRLQLPRCATWAGEALALLSER